MYLPPPRLWLLSLVLVFTMTATADAAKPACGDGVCNGKETAASCPSDCSTSSVCGDGVCDADEDCASCSDDCGLCGSCGDGVCSSDESCEICSDDCGACACACNNDGVCNDGEDCDNCPSDCPSSGKGKHRVCCGANSFDLSACGADAGAPQDRDGDGVLDCHDECPDDLAKTSPGERGCGLEDPARVTIEAGLATTLYVTGASLEIPADALVPGTVVSLEATPIEHTDYPLATSSTLVAHETSYTLTFSTTQKAKSALLLNIDVASLSNFALVRTKVVGGPFAASHPEPNWALDYPTVPGPTTLQYQMLATASEVSVIAVAPVAGSLFRSHEASVGSLAASAADASATVADAPLVGISWAATCDPEILPPPEHDCSALVVGVSDIAAAAAQFYAGPEMGFSTAHLMLFNKAYMTAVREVYPHTVITSTIPFEDLPDDCAGSA